MALAMPISDLLAAASMTKMRKMSSMPTITEKSPIVMKKVVTKLPASLALSRMFRLICITRNSARRRKRVATSSSTSWRPSSSSTPITRVTTSWSDRRLTSSSLSSARCNSSSRLDTSSLMAPLRVCSSASRARRTSSWLSSSLSWAATSLSLKVTRSSRATSRLSSTPVTRSPRLETDMRFIWPGLSNSL